MAQEDSVMELPLFVPKVFYMVLLAFGVGLYFVFGAMYGSWTDLGIYTISIICIGLGLTGTILYTIREQEEVQA